MSADMQRIPDTTLPVEVPRPQQIPIMPPRLKARLEFYKAELPPWYPVFDRIFVYPLENEDEKTASGLYIPKVTNKEVGVGVGFIVAAGPRALEQLYAHGMGLGDIVLTARLSPWERKFIGRKSKEPHTVLVLRASEIVGSIDLLDAYEKQDMWLEMKPNGRVNLADRHSARESINPPDADTDPDAV